MNDYRPSSGRVTSLPLPQSGIDIDEIRRNWVIQALVQAGGGCTAAGRLLGINRDQVRYAVKKYGLEEDLEGIRRRARVMGGGDIID